MEQSFEEFQTAIRVYSHLYKDTESLEKLKKIREKFQHTIHSLIVELFTDSEIHQTNNDIHNEVVSKFLPFILYSIVLHTQTI